MATDVSNIVNHFPSAENGFTTTTSGSVASGATTVGLNSVAGYSNAEIAVFVIDPDDSSKKQTFTGVIDTAGVQVTGVVWTAGDNQSHSAGATVVDYATATHISMVTKGILVEHAQDGTHDKELITSRTEDTTPATGDFVLTSDVSDSNALKKVTRQNFFNNAPTGFPIQAVQTDYSADTAGTTNLPVDNTIPQNTEGFEIMSQAITPKSATNDLIVEAVVLTSYDGGANNLAIAIFQDSTAAAIAASVQYQAVSAGDVIIAASRKITAGTTSATTFKVRLGAASGSGTVTFGNTRFSTTPHSFIRVTEVKA